MQQHGRFKPPHVKVFKLDISLWRINSSHSDTLIVYHYCSPTVSKEKRRRVDTDGYLIEPCQRVQTKQDDEWVPAVVVDASSCNEGEHRNSNTENVAENHLL
jgi:hypothetical protein